MPKWHMDYLELKLLKKQLMQEGHSDPPLCLPESRKQVSPLGGALPASGRRTPLSLEIGNLGREAYINEPVISLIYYSKPKLSLDSSLNEHPKPKFLCPVNSSQIYCFFA